MLGGVCNYVLRESVAATFLSINLHHTLNAPLRMSMRRVGETLDVCISPFLPLF